MIDSCVPPAPATPEPPPAPAPPGLPPAPAIPTPAPPVLALLPAAPPVPAPPAPPLWLASGAVVEGPAERPLLDLLQPLPADIERLASTENDNNTACSLMALSIAARDPGRRARRCRNVSTSVIARSGSTPEQCLGGRGVRASTPAGRQAPARPGAWQTCDEIKRKQR